MTDYEKLNYGAIAENLLASQYKNSTNLKGHLKIPIKQYANLQDVFFQLLNERDIDSAVGKQLDICGAIVGQPRAIVASNTFNYFGFLGSGGLSYGTISDPSIGGIYASVNDINSGTTIILNDDQYRILIKATTIKNRMRSTPEDILEIVEFIFNAPAYIIESVQHAWIIVAKKLDDFEKSIIKLQIDSRGRGSPSWLIPRTLGVKYDFGSFDPGDVFSYGTATDEDRFIGKFGYGTITNPLLGGTYAELFSI